MQHQVKSCLRLEELTVSGFWFQQSILIYVILWILGVAYLGAK
jgi:hypothetical protein